MIKDQSKNLNKRASLIMAIISCVVTFFLGFIFNPQEANAQKILKIGGAFEMTGATSALGYPNSEGAKLAVAEINARGGVKIGGETYKIELLLYDTRANPSEAVGIAEKLIQREKVKVIFGGPFYECAMAMQELTQPAKVIQIGVGWSGIQRILGKPGKEYLFKATPLPIGEGGAGSYFNPYVVKKFNIKTVALLEPATDPGREYVESDTKYFEESGAKIVSVQLYPHDLTDFYPLLTKIKVVNPDALSVGYTDEGVIPILRQANELGIRSRFLGAGPGVTEKAAYAMGTNKPIEGYAWISFSPPLSDPKVADFCKRYSKFFNKPCGGDVTFAIWTYETVEHILWAMQEAGSTTDTDKIVKALKSKKSFDGIVSRSYDQKGLGRSNYWIGEIEGGKAVWSAVPLKK